MRRVAQWCHDRNRTVIGIWLAAVIVLGGIATASGGAFVDNFSLPGSESQRALDQLKQKFPQEAGDSSQVVFKANSGSLNDPSIRRQVQSVDRKLARLPSIAAVRDPYAGKGAISSDGRIGFATIQFDKQAVDLNKADVQRVIDTAKGAASSSLQINLGGQAIEEAQRPAQSGTELIGVGVAIVVLLIVLGSVSAMSLPLIVAASSIGVALTIVLTFASVVDIASFAPTLAVMIALGVGIDYALLILNRFRDQRARGQGVRDATITSLDTAGRSVLFAGTTVVIALLGMVLLGISFLNGPAIAAALAVFFTMIGSLTLLPALLGTKAFGKRVKPANVKSSDNETRGWSRWARIVERRPGLFAIASTAVLLVIAFPVTGMQLGSSDAGNDAPGSTTRLAYDQLSEGFGPGFNGPLLVVSELPKRGGQTALGQLSKSIAAQDRVASVGKPILNPAGDTATLTVYPTTKPQAPETESLLRHLRNTVLPPVEHSTGITASIGGATATQADLSKVLASKLPLFIIVVVGLSLLLLALVFRSVLIPLKAAVMNVLSIGAALGMITFVFQDGHFASLIGVDTTGPIEAFLPVFMFAIAFGLSMDYEVFLVSRMHEEWEHGHNAPLAVPRGLALTGKVITAAAIIMISVFASFMLGDDRVIKLFGLGLAGAVFFDAFIIRLMLVPSLMYLFGKASWWLPEGIDRRLPRLSIEGPQTSEAGQHG
jgi:RND superfamily putative drug exporter